jgi:redox-sensing transcriptional repressor
MCYPGFAEMGVRIAAAFDMHPTPRALCGPSFFRVVRTPPPSVGIIAVPASKAQSVCDELVGCGVRALWNFAPTHLRVPRALS